MVIGRVCGNLVSTCKYPTLTGLKFFVVQPCDFELNSSGEKYIAVDSVGAGTGDLVLVIESREACLVFNDILTPVDKNIVGIIDRLDDVNGVA